MSSALVVAPVIMHSSLTGTTLLAGAAAGAAATVLAPIAVGMLLSGIAQAVDRLQERQRHACADAAATELDAIFDQVHRHLDAAPVSDRSRRKLRLELVELDAQRQRVRLALEDGSLTPTDSSDFRAAMERFSQDLTRHETLCQEGRAKREFLLQRIAATCEKYRSLGTSLSETDFAEGQAEAEQMRRTPGNDLEADLDRLGRLAGKLESTLDATIAANLEARGTCGRGAAVASAITKGLPPDIRAAIAERARIEDSRNEIRFCLQRLGQEAPEAVTDSLANLGAEAEVCPDLGRLEAIRDQFQLTWQKVRGERALSAFFAQRLSALKAVIPADSVLGGDIDNALQSPVITREMNARLVLAVEQVLTAEKARSDREAFQTQLRSQLAKHKIIVLDQAREATLAQRLNAGEAVLLPTRNEGYHALLRLSSGGEVTLRLLKIIADELEKQHVTEHMRLRDREIKTDWCSHLDLLLDDLAGAGIFALEQLRVEADLDYVTIEQLSAAKVDVSAISISRPSQGEGRPMAKKVPTPRE